MSGEFEGRMRRAGTFLSEEQRREIERLADLRQVRPATVIRDAVRSYLSRPEIREVLGEVAA